MPLTCRFARTNLAAQVAALLAAQFAAEAVEPADPAAADALRDGRRNSPPPPPPTPAHPRNVCRLSIGVLLRARAGNSAKDS
jgi:hypothetical protein